MNLGDILTTRQIVPELAAKNRWEAITAVVKKRETSMSTGIGFGIGIPHASTDLIPEVIAAFGRSRTGVSFDSLDNQPVHLVTLFLVPAGQFQRHLHTLAGIAKVLRRDDFLKSISNASDAEAMIKLIRDFSEGLR